jgi:hypothetical protein
MPANADAREMLARGQLALSRYSERGGQLSRAHGPDSPTTRRAGMA